MSPIPVPASEKKALRREMIARRDAIPRDEIARISERLAARVCALPEYTAARSLLATMSIGSEWNTRPLLERAAADGKAIVLPRISAPPRQLEIFAVGDLDRDLVPGIWEIPEPDPARCRRLSLADVDLALVPALAVDAQGYRLGYGAGYFDKLLAGRGERPLCIAVLPAAFVVKRLPHEAHDVPVDRVLALDP
jgi:5,10-methenyltetrahydrofolate synthetase